MKIAIHSRLDSFSDRWIAFCNSRGVEYKIVNAYSSDIVQQVSDCDAFMWHHSHGDYRDALFAKQLLFSLETAGIIVFPDFYTGWFFDDKVGEKYLLESIGAPIVPSYVFYSKQDALQWVRNTSFPKVFKLRGGAGSANVKLVHSVKEARRLIRKSFGKGFSPFDRIGYFKERLYKWRQGKDSILGVCKALGRLMIPTTFSKMHSSEKGYIYFQDFIENNSFDIRVIVIGDKAFSIKRMVRKNDFRASGSGDIVYDKSMLNEDAVRISFEVAEALKSQCVGFDYVLQAGKALIVEMCYGFAVHAYDSCTGYWTRDMLWHPGVFNPQEWMIEDVIKKIDLKNG